MDRGLRRFAWILGADAFDDLISRTTYVTRVSEHQQGVVDEVNATLPTTHRVMKMTVRKEDFKRSGAMKVLRNQN